MCTTANLFLFCSEDFYILCPHRDFLFHKVSSRFQDCLLYRQPIAVNLPSSLSDLQNSASNTNVAIRNRLFRYSLSNSVCWVLMSVRCFRVFPVNVQTLTYWVSSSTWILLRFLPVFCLQPQNNTLVPFIKLFSLTYAPAVHTECYRCFHLPLQHTVETLWGFHSACFLQCCMVLLHCLIMLLVCASFLLLCTSRTE